MAKRRSNSLPARLLRDWSACDEDVFIGFHGTNLSYAHNILDYGLDPFKAGSTTGLARGVGFYVSKSRGLARDYAMSASHSQKTIEGRYGPEDVAVPLAGDLGKGAVLKVYQRGRHGVIRPGINDGHINWGIQDGSGRGGNWGDDPAFVRIDGQIELRQVRHTDLEARILPKDYRYIRFRIDDDDPPPPRVGWMVHEM